MSEDKKRSAGNELETAIEHGDAEAVQRLAFDSRKVHYAIGRAIYWRHHGLVDLLLASPHFERDETKFEGWSNLQKAMSIRPEKADLRMAETFVRHGANPNTRFRTGWTMLHDRLLNKDTEAAIWLVKHGAEPHARGPNGISSFDIAIEEGFYAVAEEMVKHGASIHRPGLQGISPRSTATGKGDTRMIETRFRRQCRL